MCSQLHHHRSIASVLPWAPGCVCVCVRVLELKGSDARVLVDSLRLLLWSVLEEGGSVLHVRSLHPVIVHLERTAVDGLGGRNNTGQCCCCRSSIEHDNNTYLPKQLDIVGRNSNRVDVEHVRCEFVQPNANQGTHAQYGQLECFASIELFGFGRLEREDNIVVVGCWLLR